MRLAIAVGAILALALPLTASAVNVADYIGYAWEDGGFPTSDPGDVLEGVGIVNWIDPITGIDLSSTEVSWHIYDLVSGGEFVDGNGTTIVSYTGGMLDLYVDPSPDADWGTFPPNLTAPASFIDGGLLFSGSFSSFTLFVASDGSGAYEGYLDGVAGTLLGGPCSDCAYTWGGAFTPDAGAQIPDGYDLQIDGQLDVDSAVSTTQSSWGAVKSLYQQR